MSIAGRPLFVDDFPRFGIQREQVAIFPAKIDQPVVDHRRGDIGTVSGQGPGDKLFRIGDIALTVRSDADHFALFCRGGHDESGAAGGRGDKSQRLVVSIFGI